MLAWALTNYITPFQLCSVSLDRLRVKRVVIAIVSSDLSKRFYVVNHHDAFMTIVANEHDAPLPMVYRRHTPRWLPSNLPPFRHGAVPWTTAIHLPVPGSRGWRFRLLFPNIPGFHHFVIARFGRRNGTLSLLALYLFILLGVYTACQIIFGPVPTLVFRRHDLQQIWQWEIASGHHPTAQRRTRQFTLDIYCV